MKLTAINDKKQLAQRTVVVDAKVMLPWIANVDSDAPKRESPLHTVPATARTCVGNVSEVWGHVQQDAPIKAPIAIAMRPCNNETVKKILEAKA